MSHSPVSLIALDVDGTTLTPEHTITAAVDAAVRRALRAGVQVLLSTSRGPRALQPVAEQLGLADQWFSAFQGALLGRFDRHGELQTLARSCIDASVASSIFVKAHDEGLSPGRFSDDDWTVARIDSATTRAAAITGEKPQVRDLEQITAMPGPLKLMIIAQNPEQIPALHHLADWLPRQVNGSFSHANYLEVTTSGAHKGAGLRALAAHLRVPLERCAAVGDGLNDVPAFHAAGVSVAMGHSPMAVKQAATHVTGSNSEDGVAKAIDLLLDHPTP